MWEEMEDFFADELRGEESFSYDGIDDSVQVTEDGCSVEPDGRCPHGFPSPMIRLLGI